MKTVIEMAREAGIGWGEGIGGMPDFLERFAELVRADERARMAEQPAQQEPIWFWTHPTHGRLYKQPPAQRKPLTDEQQIAESLRVHGLTLVKTASGYEVLKLGQITANSTKENT